MFAIPAESDQQSLVIRSAQTRAIGGCFWTRRGCFWTRRGRFCSRGARAGYRRRSGLRRGRRIARTRAGETRRRGARWRLRAGLFASPVSAFAALVACLLVCLLAIVFVLWDPHRACRDACTTTSLALGARRGGDPGGAVDMDSNASRAGEVERKVWAGRRFSAARQLLKMSQLVDGNPLC